ncbi:biotin-dependent carboxyltransferase family protein [Aquimarina sp. D1M17]|uniref:5-oxoprolinase subunit C family protein n=1 Tax=Aquimarina acroporae TaxID=2937283 RepID=UPI0020BF0756|nr:biotin-dependent carboxyltransferase family protein [Aquimarina acroporae]MCK8523387.1 biotin-dependent carboxyltransferase family protein [Aquimarina acroporae]
MMGIVEILNSGFYSSIQDRGRLGYGEMGVPKSGAMDQSAYDFANLLLNNDEDCACLEWVFKPPVLRFSESTCITLTGAQTDFFLNGKKIENNRQIQVFENDVLKGDFCKNKKYGYVGIKKGFLSEVILGSRSFYKGITRSDRLAKGDEVSYEKWDGYEGHSAKVAIRESKYEPTIIKVYKGPEFDLLTEEQKDLLFTSKFTVSNVASRMAIQLSEVLPNSIPSMLTSPVLPGTVQLTPFGKLMVLMRDCQTTGGYPRVLQLGEASINNIAQKRTKEHFFFKEIEF